MSYGKINNMSPEHELCHDMLPTMRQMAMHMVKGEDDVAFKKGRLVPHIEVLVGQSKDASRPLTRGLFVDVMSNDFMFRMVADRKYERARELATDIVPFDKWMQAVQAMNLKKLGEKPEEFDKIRRACIDKGVPLFLRSVNSSGKVEFKPVDLKRTHSIADLAQNHALPKIEDHPRLVPILERIASKYQSEAWDTPTPMS